MLQAVVPYPVRETWTHEFCCLPNVSQSTTPSAGQSEALVKAGIGKTKIVFDDRKAKHKEVCKKLEETFPKLMVAGGFTLLRAKTGGQNRPLTQLSCAWYNISDIKKEVTGTACIYIRPVQNNLDMKPQEPVSEFYINSKPFWTIFSNVPLFSGYPVQ